MTRDIYIPISVASQIDELSANLPQSLLLTGEMGIGLRHIATHISKKYKLLASVSPKLLTKSSTIPQISVEQIRELYTITRSKQRNPQSVIIDDADKMSLAAQNAFLKLLEEPPRSIHFILTSHSPEHLLLTIRSRTRVCHVPKVSTAQTKALIQSLAISDATKSQQILFIAEGLPAEIIRLVQDDDYFQKTKTQMQLAKKLVVDPPYSRITCIANAKLNRSDSLSILERYVSLLSRTPSSSSMQRMKAALESYSNISKGANTRLQLVQAVL